MLVIKTRAADIEITIDGVPVIHLTLQLPEIKDTRTRAERRIDAFYAHMLRAVDLHARRRMLRQAAKSLKRELGRSRPFEPYRVKMRSRADISDDGAAMNVVRELYVRREPGDERERRFTELWDLKSGLISRSRSEKIEYPPLDFMRPPR
ncbi:MAG: hypothetical protein LBH17_08245 [Oscillospiraceae bacterium]|jgi:hypothetical protein|nr:hypothetical protein [Oscillospiraceae bacterium]